MTENGFSIPRENALSREQAIEDTGRVHFYAGYLNALLDAVNIDGVKILGYMAWSLLEYRLLRCELTTVTLNGQRVIIPASE